MHTIISVNVETQPMCDVEVYETQRRARCPSPATIQLNRRTKVGATGYFCERHWSIADDQVKDWADLGASWWFIGLPRDHDESREDWQWLGRRYGFQVDRGIGRPLAMVVELEGDKQ